MAITRWTCAVLTRTMLQLSDGHMKALDSVTGYADD